jgi:hypothetical protein
MKKYTLDSLYVEAESILKEAEIDITTESKLDISVCKVKKNNKEKPETEYIIQFNKHENDANYYFVYAGTPKSVISKFREEVLPDVDSDIAF